MKILTIVGARPQFIKHAAIENAIKTFEEIDLITVHTGQHYDDNMSQIFFNELEIPKPKYNLNIGSGSHGHQTGIMLMEIEKVIKEEQPSWVVVYGDTNSTLAGALAATKLNIKVAHIEAGLRSFNKSMPEEINRILTDHVSDFLFCPTEISKNHLANEGITKGVHIVGDIMYDVLKLAFDNRLIMSNENKETYYLSTIHRPYNTDDPSRIKSILIALNQLDGKVFFPIHPRTKILLKKYKVNLKIFDKINFIEPQSYFENMNLLYNSKGLITDSGGMQKEAYWLKKKCVTVRPETEWVETLEGGWNTLVWEDFERINRIFSKPCGEYFSELYGAGNSSSKIIKMLLQYTD